MLEEYSLSPPTVINIRVERAEDGPLAAVDDVPAPADGAPEPAVVS